MSAPHVWPLDRDDDDDDAGDAGDAQRAHDAHRRAMRARVALPHCQTTTPPQASRKPTVIGR